MGTNYYGKKIVTETDKQAIALLVLKGDFNAAIYALQSFDPIHIGKSSAGWRFLFNTNDWGYYKDWKSFCDWLDTVEITSEYGDTKTKDELIALIKEKELSATQRPSNTDWYIERGGMQFSKSTEFC